MQLTLHATRRTPHGDSRLVPAMSAWSVKTPHAPSRHCRDPRVYGHTTAALHEYRVHPSLRAGTSWTPKFSLPRMPLARSTYGVFGIILTPTNGGRKRRRLCKNSHLGKPYSRKRLKKGQKCGDVVFFLPSFTYPNNCTITESYRTENALIYSGGGCSCVCHPTMYSMSFNHDHS